MSTTPDPEERLAAARDQFPTPHAFKESAKALRAMIRQRKRDNEEFDDLLARLYDLAARHAFLHNTPHVEGVGPAFNVADSIPEELWGSLKMPYQEIGVSHLTLLTETDKKRMINSWGYPDVDADPQELHREVWEEAVARVRQAERDRRDEVRAKLDELRSADQTTRKASRSGCLSVAIFVSLSLALATRSMVLEVVR